LAAASGGTAIEDIPFVFEEPKASYYGLDYGVRKALLSLGPMAADRLAHIEKVHVVFQPLEDIQITIARRLDLPHYQATTSQVTAAKFGNLSIFKESGNAAVHDDFMMYVGNEHSAEVKHLLSTIDFDAIGLRLLSNKPKHSVRQSYFEDFGWTSNQCTSRKDDALGIAGPRVKPGTGEAVIKTLLRTCSDILRALNLKLFDFGVERVRLFAGKLAANNVVEAMRMAITDGTNLCGIHEDGRNDTNFPEVPVFSKFIVVGGKRYRVSIIMYSRQSIWTYLNRKNRMDGESVRWVLRIFNGIPHERRFIIADSFPRHGSESSNCHGLAYSQVPCHMHPSFFVSPVIHFGLMLAFTHSLDLAELVSIFRAWAAMPYTTYFFTSAVVILLQAKVLPCRGLPLGRFLLLLMRKLKEENTKQKIPGLRFANYRAVHVPGKQAWVDSTTEIVRLCLDGSFRSEPPGCKKERASLYETTRKGIMKEIKYAGPLVTNHLMAVLSIVGLVPLWYGEEHTADDKSKSMAYLRLGVEDHQNLPPGRAESQRFLDTLSSALSLQYGFASSRRYAENVLCKAFRQSNPDKAKLSDQRFSDLLFENQCVFKVVGREVHIQKGVVKGGLIDHWAMSGQFWQMKQLLLQCGTMTKEEFTIPKGLGQCERGKLPDWVKNLFPDRFMMKDWRKAQTMIDELVAQATTEE
jgi:hypothetical protein